MGAFTNQLNRQCAYIFKGDTMKAYAIEGQMSIFDFLKPQLTSTSHIEPLPSIIDKICEEAGLVLNKTYDSFFNRDEWTLKRGKFVIDVHFSQYSCDQMDGTKKGDWFIHVGTSYPTGGSGCPCDTVEKAVRNIKSAYKQMIKFNTKKEKAS